MNTAPIVSRVWSFCTTLRDDGVSYGDYLEQLTFLIFLKMADEYLRIAHGAPLVVAPCGALLGVWFGGTWYADCAYVW